MHKILVIRLYFLLDALHVSDYISPSSGATFYKLYIAFGMWKPFRENFTEFCRRESFNTYVRTNGFQRHETKIYYYIHRKMHLCQKRGYNLNVSNVFRIIVFTDVIESVIKNASYYD